MEVIRTINVEIGKDDVVRYFCKTDSREQAEIIKEIMDTFNAWGADKKYTQMLWIYEHLSDESKRFLQELIDFH